MGEGKRFGTTDIQCKPSTIGSGSTSGMGTRSILVGLWIDSASRTTTCTWQATTLVTVSRRGASHGEMYASASALCRVVKLRRHTHAAFYGAHSYSTPQLRNWWFFPF